MKLNLSSSHFSFFPSADWKIKGDRTVRWEHRTWWKEALNSLAVFIVTLPSELVPPLPSHSPTNTLNVTCLEKVSVPPRNREMFYQPSVLCHVSPPCFFPAPIDFTVMIVVLDNYILRFRGGFVKTASPLPLWKLSRGLCQRDLISFFLTLKKLNLSLFPTELHI